jgi:hypothetical protein
MHQMRNTSDRNSANFILAQEKKFPVARFFLPRPHHFRAPNRATPDLRIFHQYSTV